MQQDKRFLGYYWQEVKKLIIPATPLAAAAIYSFVLIFMHYHRTIFNARYYQNLIASNAKGMMRWLANLLQSTGLLEIKEWFIVSMGLKGIWYMLIPVIFILLTLIVVKIFPRTKTVFPQYRFRDYGFRLGTWPGWRDTLIFFAIMMPFVAFAVFQKDFSRMYPMSRMARETLTWFVVWEAAHLLHMFGWEFVNRGLLLFGLEEKMGNWAILATAIPFAVLHIGKPELEAYGSFFAAIALGWIALRSRSFLPGVFLHWGVAFVMDLVAIFRAGGFSGG